MNCHFGKEVDARFEGKTTKNAKSLLSMVERQNMYIVDGSKLCTGPNYTFYVEGVGESYIDHIIISKGLIPNVSNCCIIEDCINNTSDHLPVNIEIAMDIPNLCIDSDQMTKIPWRKYSEEEILTRYTERLNILLHRNFAKEQLDREEDISTTLSQIIECVLSISRKLQPKKFSKGLKPYWTDKLKAFSTAEKRLGKIW